MTGTEARGVITESRLKTDDRRLQRTMRILAPDVVAAPS